jgi:hypothetical protein
MDALNKMHIPQESGKHHASSRVLGMITDQEEEDR